VTKIINNTSLRTAHVKALVKLAVDKEYVGIDIDYENGTRAEDRPVFTLFVQEQAKALHPAGKKLSVTVQPKLSEPGNQPRHKIQDWNAIGAVADEVHVMVYDYWPDNGQASRPPLSWWTAQASFAVSQIPGRKLMLGAATYGYHWARAKSPVEDLEWRSIEDLRKRMEATRVHDEDTRSAHYTYTQNSTRRHVWLRGCRCTGPSCSRGVRNYGMPSVGHEWDMRSTRARNLSVK